MTAAEIAIENEYDYVICGHIHQPQKRIIRNGKGSVSYLNSGDWIENLTALEYDGGEWNVYNFQRDNFLLSAHSIEETAEIFPATEDLNSKQLFEELLRELKFASYSSNLKMK